MRLDANEKKTQALIDSLCDVRTSLGMMEETMQESINSGNDADEQQNAEVARIRDGVGTVMDRVERLEGVVANAKASHGKLEERVECMSAVVDERGVALDENVSLSRALTDSHQGLTDQLRDAASTIQQQADRHHMLKERVDVTETVIKGLDTRHKETHNKVESHWLELEKTNARLTGTCKNLDDTNANLSCVGNELGLLTKEVVTKLVPRLDLAHQYLQGVGQGIQEANQNITEGKEGMIRPKKKAASNTLPGLPGAMITGGIMERPATR